MTDNRPARCTIRLFYFSLAGLLLGYISVESFFVPLRQNHEFKNWQPVPCRITVSNPRPWGRPQDALYLPEIRYAYSVQGEEYVGAQFAWSHSLKPGSKEKVEALLASFPEGARAECFVEPGYPGRAYLQRPQASGWFPLWMGSLAFLGCGASLFWLIEEFRRKPLPA